MLAGDGEGCPTALGAGKRPVVPKSDQEKTASFMPKREAEERSRVRSGPSEWIVGVQEASLPAGSKCEPETRARETHEAGREAANRLNLREPCENYKGFLWNKIKEVQRQTKKWLITKIRAGTDLIPLDILFLTRSAELNCYRSIYTLFYFNKESSDFFF